MLKFHQIACFRNYRQKNPTQKQTKKNNKTNNNNNKPKQNKINPILSLREKVVSKKHIFQLNSNTVSFTNVV